MSLTDLTIQAFLDKTAGNEPVPGGGSISALCGALAASLAEMVTRLTIGRKKYADVEEQMQELSARFATIRQEMARYIDRDAEAYDRVFQAFKLPKETEEEKELRHQAIQQATKHAAQIPMEVAHAAAEAMPFIAEVTRHGNANAVTDACVAMMCARNAVLGALLNVRINLSSIDDEAFVNDMAAEACRLELEAVEMEKEILHYVKEKIK